MVGKYGVPSLSVWGEFELGDQGTPLPVSNSITVWGKFELGGQGIPLSVSNSIHVLYCIHAQSRVCRPLYVYVERHLSAESADETGEVILVLL